LCGFLADSADRLMAEMRLFGGDEQKDVGWITSATEIARLGRQIALGYVKRGFQTPGTRLEAVAKTEGDHATRVPVSVVALPFEGGSALTFAGSES
jgi:glycine cleavage system aminomethyltransferase T